MARTKKPKIPPTKYVKVGSIKENPDNPRIIKDEAFQKLVKSIKNFPQMLTVRPVVINSDKMILGGNRRFQAAIEAGRKEVPTITVEEWTDEQEAEFIIKDNVSSGEWNHEMLSEQWDAELLDAWGLENFKPDDVNLDDFFEEDEEGNIPATREGKHLIVFDFDDEKQYEKVKSELNKKKDSKEVTLCKLLGIE